jgi:hypothetical protein
MTDLAPLILLAVAKVFSGVQEQSYSPDNKYTAILMIAQV